MHGEHLQRDGSAGHCHFRASAVGAALWHTRSTFSYGPRIACWLARLSTFRAAGHDPAAVDPVVNTGLIQAAWVIAATPSNPVQTAIRAQHRRLCVGGSEWGRRARSNGEPGLSGVQVCATPVGGGTPVCDTTDANGEYRIYGLTAALDYTVALDPGHPAANYQPTTCPLA